MSIKRGVSFYSWQQEQYLKRMDWKDMIREVVQVLKTDGVEIINEATIRHYPFPTEEFIYAWNNEMARWGAKAVTMDVYLDSLRFRDHLMTYGEAAELLKNDIKIAAAMGFENVRCLCNTPIDVIDRALDTAVKYNVRIGKEIHAPFPIKRDAKAEGGTMVTDLLEYVDKKKTNMVGLVPDMGIFQFKGSRVVLENLERNAKPGSITEFALKNRDKMSLEEIGQKVNEKWPKADMFEKMILRALETKSVADPEDLREIAPYILSIHGKFNEMTEIPDMPGHYIDEAFDYENPIRILKECGYEGYINSEYEGQRAQQDDGIEGLADEREEVRRHHEMMARYIGEDIQI